MTGKVKMTEVDIDTDGQNVEQLDCELIVNNSASTSSAHKQFVRQRAMRNKRMFLDLLFGMLTQNFVSARGLNLYAPDHSTVSRFLTEAKDNKLIKKLSYVEKQNYTKLTTQFYCLTNKGVSYLVQNSAEDSWLRSIPNDNYSFGTYNGDSITNRIVSFVQQADIVTMMSRAGVSVPPTFVAQTIDNMLFDLNGARAFTTNEGNSSDETDEDTIDVDFEINFDDEAKAEKPLLANAVLEALMNAAEPEQINNGIYYLTPLTSSSFTPASYIRGVNALNNFQDTKFNRGKFVGLLETPFMSVLVIHGSKLGMTWKPFVLKNTFRQINAYVKRNGRYSKLPPDREILLVVDNAKMFSDLYTDKAKVRGKSEWIGSDTRHCYVMPLHNDGVKQLKELAETSTEEYEKGIIDKATQDGAYHKNFGTNTWLFPIVTNDETPVYVGTRIDLVKLHSLSSDSCKGFAILCHPWQKDYYKRIMPDVKLLTVAE